MTTGRDRPAEKARSRAAKGEHRCIKRARSRVLVRFGTTVMDRTAFTQNVSESGLFVHTNQVLRPGTTVQLAVQFPDRKFTFWGRVIWAKKVPPQLAHLLDCGMGVRFIDPSPEWLEFYETWKRRFGI